MYLTIIYLLLITSNWCAIDAVSDKRTLSDKRRCADEKCSVPISKAKTLRTYNAPENGILSFMAGEEVIIFSKEAGSNPDLWGGEINGKRGYLPKLFLRETKVLTSNLMLVDTEISQLKEVPSSKSEPIVIDGTTIYDEITPTNTESVPIATSVPDINVPNNVIGKEEQSENNDDEEEIEVEEEEDDDDDEESVDDEDADEDTTQERKEEKVVINGIQNTTVSNENNKMPVLESKSDKSVDTTHTINPDMSNSALNVNTLDEINNNASETLNNIPVTITEEHLVDKTIEQGSNIISTSKENTDKILPTIADSGNTAPSDESKLNDFKSILNITSNEKTNEVEVDSFNALPTIEKPLEILSNIAEDANLNKVTEMNPEESKETIITKGAEHDANKVEEVSQPSPLSPSEDLPAAPSKILDKVASFLNIEESAKSNPDIQQTQPLSSDVNSFSLNQNNIRDLPDNGVPGYNSAETESTTAAYTETTWNYFNDYPEAPSDSVTTQTPTSLEETSDEALRKDPEEVIQQKTLELESTEEPNDAASDSTQAEIYADPVEAQTESEVVSDDSEGWISFITNMFGSKEEPQSDSAEVKSDLPNYYNEEKPDGYLPTQMLDHGSCSSDDYLCGSYDNKQDQSNEYITEKEQESVNMFDFLVLNDTILFVAVSGFTVVLFLLGYMFIEKMRKEGPLVGKINQLEQKLLIINKENEILTSKMEEMASNAQEMNESVSSELMLELQKDLDDSNEVRAALEEQVQALEKELENSTEVGLELNRMLSDVLSSQNGSDVVLANIEQLQKQLVEQQCTINTVNSQLNERDTENHELQLELEINNKKVIDLQAELEKMMLNFLKIEEEKEAVISKSESEVNELRTSLAKLKATSGVELAKSSKDLAEAKSQFADLQRRFDIKEKEYVLLKQSFERSDGDKKLLDQSVLKAELEQFQQENKILNERVTHDQTVMKNLEAQVAYVSNENQALTKRFEGVEREKLEALTKLEVLSAYFKEKESELQRQLSKHEAMWNEKRGEASSTTERIKFLQEEIENYKAQVTSLQQEIISQEVDLKSQISLLEKKGHENWVAARKAERKIEDARQESAQLRNRLTLRERSFNEEQMRNGIQSPLEANGVDHINDTASSPPLIFGGRDHLTTSPPLPMLPGFPLPPPGVGVPFMPPPLPGMPPFMPPPPSMFPGDHRPPPLGRMSSPPINSRYTPDSRVYSPYDRHTPSPTDDEYYDRDSFYNQPISKRNSDRRNGYSTGSNSNESIDKLDRDHTKV